MDRRRLVLVYGIAAGVLALDQLTKWVVVANLSGRPPVRLIDDVVRLVYATNSGGAFSLLTGFPLFFAIMAIVVIGAIVYYARQTSSAAILGVLGLLLGGALGNFTDRLLRGETLLHGRVIDFVDIGAWPVFNVADAAITIGAVGLALLLSRTPPSRAGSGGPDGDGPGAAPAGDAAASGPTPGAAPTRRP